MPYTRRSLKSIFYHIVFLLFNTKHKYTFSRVINSLGLNFGNCESGLSNEGVEAGNLRLVRERKIRVGLREFSRENERETRPERGRSKKMAPRRRKVGFCGERLNTDATSSRKSDADGAVMLGEDGRER